MDVTIDICEAPAGALDPRPVARRIGLILLATDHTSELDFRAMAPGEGLGIYANRLAFENPTTPENLRRMAPRLTGAAAMILPGADLDAICYCCTAASVELGDAAIADAVHKAKPGVPVITPSLAARAALHALGVRRISILTPYLRDTSRPMAGYFARHGIEPVNLTCLGMANDQDMARVPPARIVEAACATISPDAEALFISCTALRARSVAAEIERRIGKPVVTSNQASIWLTLHRAGLTDPIQGCGRVTTLTPPDP